MTVPWLRTPTAPRPATRRRALLASLPRIVTDRLILRAPWADDWTMLEPIWTSDRARYIGGPMEAEDGWLDFNQMVASWLLRGFGPLTITLKDTGDVVGIVSLDHEWARLADPAGEVDGTGIRHRGSPCPGHLGRGRVGRGRCRDLP